MVHSVSRCEALAAKATDAAAETPSLIQDDDVARGLHLAAVANHAVECIAHVAARVAVDNEARETEAAAGIVAGDHDELA